MKMYVAVRILWLFLAAGYVPGPACAQAVKVPFTRDLQLTWASTLAGEPDYEHVVTVVQVDNGEARLRVSWNRGLERKWQSVERRVSSRERRLARSLYFYSSARDFREFRGTNQSLASSAILGELKRTGRSDIVLLMPNVSTAPFRGTIERVGSGTEAFPVLLNGRPVKLPGLRARGMMGVQRVDFEVLVLDDPEAPWILEAFSKRTGGSRQLVRIATDAREPDVASALEKRCITSVHDIYFATGSDALDSTSTPAFEAIARTLERHPDWRITIVGHTDSIGTAASNLDLARRRAEKVRAILVGQHRIATGRLRAEGRGETEPLDDNGTIPGRSRNRRVDLVRACR